MSAHLSICSLPTKEGWLSVGGRTSYLLTTDAGRPLGMFDGVEELGWRWTLLPGCTLPWMSGVYVGVGELRAM